MKVKLDFVKADITKTIDTLKDTNKRLVLLYRFVLLKSWEDIAKTLHYTKIWVIEISKVVIRKLKQKKTSPHFTLKTESKYDGIKM